MFKTIVVGVDGREGGRDALHLAGRLALVNGGDLVAVRVLPFDYYVSRAGSPPFADLAEADARKAVQAELDAASLEARIQVVGDSSPARALHGIAEQHNADVIVVGSTHHSRLGRVLAGDDAVGTIHGSSCAVAVAPRGLSAQEWRPVETIGVGFDGGAESRQALALAMSLAAECGASLKVRWVVQAPVAQQDSTPYDHDWLARARADAEKGLAEGLAGVVAATGDVVVGDTVEMLVGLSREVDLLIVGSRAWGPVRRILIGSTAARLTHQAEGPMMILPRGAATGQPGEAEPSAQAGAPAPA